MILEKFSPLEGKMLSIMDIEGNVIEKDLMPEINDDRLVDLYKTMLLTKVVDTKALQYQRQGRMLTYAPNRGQEAAQLGAIAATEERDWLVPAFRELGAWLYKGVPLEQIYIYWYGSEMGSKFPDNVKMLPVAVPIASQINHGAGLAMASKYKGEDSVTMAFVGDGGTSHGEFHEGMNFAAVFDAPLVVIIQNNQYAISVPRHLQTRAKTLAEKAIGYGIPGIQVDGNDIFAMYAAAKEAVERARRGEGPTLIEAVTYRLGPHTTSDDPTIYREDIEVEEWAKKDPIVRFKKYLIKRGLWSEEQDVKEIEDYEELVNETFKKVENSGETPLEDIFIYHYETMPQHLQEQLEEYRGYLEGRDK